MCRGKMLGATVRSLETIMRRTIGGNVRWTDRPFAGESVWHSTCDSQANVNFAVTSSPYIEQSRAAFLAVRERAQTSLSVTSICLLSVLAIGCDREEGPATAPLSNRTLQARSHYVAPNGTASANGSITAPWDLATALSQPHGVFPGDTIWLRSGTYRGDFVSNLAGQPGKPVVLRQYRGERATIDGRLDIAGSYATYWDFEVMYSHLARISAIPGSDPADVPRENKTVFITGPFIKVINLIIHDLGDGLFSGVSAEGLEIYGTLLYNNGWQGPPGDRGNGHSLYLQNRLAQKRIIDNVMYNSFSSGLKVGGSSASYLLNFWIEGNTSFSSGSSVRHVFGHSWNMHMEGAGNNMGNAMFERNSFYHENGLDEAFRLNAAADPPGSGLTFRNNIVQGMSVFNEWSGYVISGNKFTSGRTPVSGQSALLALRMVAGAPYSGHQWNNNAYAAPASSPKVPFYLVPPGDLHNLATWRATTGYDLISTYLAGTFPGADIIVRPNQYEPGRAFITIWNWNAAPTVAVDLSSVLQPGDPYRMHHVYDVFGPPLLSGVYAGSPVSIPQTGFVPPPPIGNATPAATTSPHFNVFLVRRQ